MLDFYIFKASYCSCGKKILQTLTVPDSTSLPIEAHHICRQAHYKPALQVIKSTKEP